MLLGAGVTGLGVGKGVVGGCVGLSVGRGVVG
jgi:hypothetical protein